MKNNPLLRTICNVKVWTVKVHRKDQLLFLYYYYLLLLFFIAYFTIFDHSVYL